MGPLEVRRLTTPGYHFVGKVPGLMLQVSASGARSWLLRVSVGSKRREIGLGAFPGVTLALAHKKAQDLRDVIAAGVDPVVKRAADRQAIVQQQIDAKAMDWTFQRCAEAYIKAKKDGWRNAKHKQQWLNTLQTYVYPSIGDMLVRHVNIGHVIAIVEPHWTTKNETINRVRNRIELVLDWAAVRKLRAGDNPARWKGNLDKLLADRAVVARVTGHRALGTGELHGFMRKLRELEGTGARCLEFVILTACRSGEARFAKWSEIDYTGKTWNIPGERMKSGRPHRVPLTGEAMKLLTALPRVEGEDLVFSGRLEGKPISDMTMTKVMRNMGANAVPHGFRSTFSSWCASSTAYPSEVREMALAHAIPDGTVAAYQRSDLFEKRRSLMADWAKFISANPSKDGSVVALRRGAA